MSQSVTFSAANGGEKIVVKLNEAARGPAGPGGGQLEIARQEFRQLSEDGTVPQEFLAVVDTPMLDDNGATSYDDNGIELFNPE